MSNSHPPTSHLSMPFRVLTLYVAVTMAFALGFILAFATKLEPHLVALSFGVVALSASYCLLVAVYLWLAQRRVTGKPTILK